ACHPRKKMAAPSLRDPIGEGAILVRLAFHRGRVLLDRQDPLSIMMSSCMSATDSADKESFIYNTFSSHLWQTLQPSIDCLALFCEWYIFVVSAMRRTKHS